MTASTRVPSRELPAQDDYNQIEAAYTRAYSGLEPVVWHLQDVVSRYNQTGELPPSGPPTFADVGAIYAFVSNLEVDASTLTETCATLRRLLEEVDGMRRDAPFQGGGSDV